LLYDLQEFYLCANDCTRTFYNSLRQRHSYSLTPDTGYGGTS